MSESKQPKAESGTPATKSQQKPKIKSHVTGLIPAVVVGVALVGALVWWMGVSVWPESSMI